MKIVLACLMVLVSCVSANANSGWGGITATGLTFSETESVQLVEEDLVIGPDRISVDYVFRNITGQDVTGEVIFPLPPIGVEQIGDYGTLYDVRNKDNMVEFSVAVDGAPQAVRIDRMAVIEPEDAASSPAQSYDNPGRDVTSIIKRYGLQLQFDEAAFRSAFRDMSPQDRASADSEGIINLWEDGEHATPLWSIVLRYHWTQTFAAGQDVSVHIEYENRSAGGLFGWLDPPEANLTDPEMKPLGDLFCIDTQTSKDIYALLKDFPDGEMPYNRIDGRVSTLAFGGAQFTFFILRTANTWAGPIGRFRLTVDKGDPETMVSLCLEDLKQTSSTTYVFERENYVPDQDLAILHVFSMGYFLEHPDWGQ
jgi:Domain of unknown function (DUF4424)